jgi:hypothetical protein
VRFAREAPTADEGDGESHPSSGDLPELDFVGDQHYEFSAKKFESSKERFQYLRGKFLEKFRDGTFDELAVDFEERRKKGKLPVSPDRWSSTAAGNASPARRKPAAEEQSPTVPYGTPLHQRLHDVLPDAELDERRASKDGSVLAIDLEEMEDELWQDEEVGAGLFMNQEHATQQDMFPGLELDDVQVTVDEPLPIDLEDIDEEFWPEEEAEEEEAGAGLFAGFLSRERTTVHEM